MTRHLTLLATGLAALTVAGCGVHDPYNDKPAARRPGPATAAGSAPHHAPDSTARRPAGDRANPAALTNARPKANAAAEAVAAAYGLAQTNWTWRTYADQYRRMTRLAGGALARDLKRHPPEPDQLEGITAERQTNRSSALAVDSKLVTATTARVIVVYEELAGGAGVSDTAPRHTVYRARVSKLPAGWKVTQWSLLP
jgi:hypothetical protein